MTKRKILFAGTFMVVVLVNAIPRATAQEDPRGAIADLAKKYFAAIADEDAEAVAATYRFQNDEARRKQLTALKKIFVAADTQFTRVDVESIDLHPDGTLGTAFVRTEAQVVSADNSDRLTKTVNYALVVTPSNNGWRIARVMTQQEYVYILRTLEYVRQQEDDPDSPQAGTRLVIGSASQVTGGTVRVPITLVDASRLGDLNVTLSYPSDLLEFVHFENGVLPLGTIFDANPESPGTIYLGLAHQEGINGRVVLGRLDFKLIGPAGSTAKIAGTVTSANSAATDQSARVGIVNGIVNILDDSEPGDFDGDGEVTALDALAALRMSTGKLAEDLVLDIDQSGQVTAKDARLILQIAVGAGTLLSK